MRSERGFSLIEILIAMLVFSAIALLSVAIIPRTLDYFSSGDELQSDEVRNFTSAIESDILHGFEFKFSKDAVAITTLAEDSTVEVIDYFYNRENDGISRCNNGCSINFFKNATITLEFELHLLNENARSPIFEKTYKNSDFSAILIIAKVGQATQFEHLATSLALF